MSRYTVRARRCGDWWAIDVPGMRGVHSQAKRLEQVEDMAREVLAMHLDVPEDTVQIVVQIELDERVRRMADDVKAAREAAARAEREATHRVREAANELRRSGLPVRDVGAVLGVSAQYVSKVTKTPAA